MNISDLEVDFDDSLNLNGIVGALITKETRPALNFLRDLYFRNHAVDISPIDSPRIPKSIHQIWLGSELPERFRSYQRNWQRLHPDWEYRLWTDRDISDGGFDNLDLIEKTDCFAQKTDILRAEILFRHGGLYLDVDYECLKPLDLFHHAFDFFASIRLLPGLYMKWPDVVRSPVIVCNSIVGSVAGHPILENYLRRVRSISGNSEIGRLAEQLTAAERRNTDHAPTLIKARLEFLAAYMPFTDAFLSQEQTGNERNISVPPNFFNPIDNWWTTDRFRRTIYWQNMIGSVVRNGYHRYRWDEVPPEAFAVHHSAASWL